MRVEQGERLPAGWLPLGDLRRSRSVDRPLRRGRLLVTCAVDAGGAAHASAASGERTVTASGWCGWRGINAVARPIRTATAVTPMKTWCAACASAGTDGDAESKEALAIAPKNATPMALPIERLNMLAAVTTPRSSQPTVFWAAMRTGAATRPSPAPTTKQQTPTSSTLDRVPRP